MTPFNVTNQTVPIYMNMTNATFITQPDMVTNPPPPPPWYVLIIPELVLAVGIVATVLTFYFSPGVRNSFRAIFNRLRK